MDGSRHDMVRHLLERGIVAARFEGLDHAATAAYFAAARDAVDLATGSSAQVWLADSFRSFEDPGVDPTADWLVIEACLPSTDGDAADLVPVLVEVDRAVLRSRDGDSYRRLDFSGEGMRMVEIEPVVLEQLDRQAVAAGWVLARRVADTSGSPHASGPAHLSWFRHISREPATAAPSSHS